MDAPDPSALRRLILSKGFLLRGEELSRTGDPLDSMVAIHHLHLAVEVAARAMLLRYDLGGKDAYDPPFSGILKTLEKAENVKAAGGLTYLADIRKLNQRRNLVQHDAEAVAPTVLEETRVIVRLFLEKLVKDHFGVALGALDDLEYIQDENLRTAVRLAREVRLVKGRIAEDVSLAFLRVAFEEASQTSWSGRQRSTIFVLNHRTFQSWAESIEDRQILSASGVNLQEFQRFVSIVPAVLRMVNGSFQVHLTRGPAPPEYVDWADNFVVSSILRWQRAGFSPRLIDQHGRTLSKMREILGEQQAATDK